MSTPDPAKLADAEIIIIGGGIIGCSIAYGLAKLGKKDVLLLEKSGLTHGSSWHAVGMVGALRANKNYTRMNSLGFELYSQIEAETGLSPGWRGTGSMRLASSDFRWREIRRQAALAKAFGFPIELLGPNEIKAKCPIIDISGVKGAAFMPTDGYVEPHSVTMAIAKGARMRGARLVEGVRVTGIERNGRRMTAVVTDHGTFRCDTLVIAAGTWSNRVGRMAGVDIPAGGVLHQYMVSEPVVDLPKDIPGFRDPDNQFYLDPQASGRIALGGFEDKTYPFNPPWEFGRELVPEDMERLEQVVTNASVRVPLLRDIGIKTIINGPIPVSPDGNPVLGKPIGTDNLYVADGFTSGFSSGGGAGRVMAEWIVGGEQPFDLWPLDIRRFPPQFSRPDFLDQRCVEVHVQYYRQQGITFEYQSARPARVSPLYRHLRDDGAVFGSKFGWERPNWFTRGSEAPAAEAMVRRLAEEHRTVREAVALVDQTSFAKLELSGPGALALLQRLAANDIDKPPGTLVYTQMCNERGGIVADIVVNRLAADRFYVVTGTGFPQHDFEWIRERMPAAGSVVMTDVTSGYAVLNICGPKSRALLAAVTDADMSTAAFPFMTSRTIAIGFAPVRAQRVGFVGELGWELHVPSEYAVHVYERLHAAGEAHGLANVGYKAIDSLRLEKSYKVWGADLTEEDNPFEAGLGMFVRFDKPDFIGRAALEKVKRDGPQRLLSTFSLGEYCELFGGEAIYAGGKHVGYATSAGYGQTVGRSIVLGYVPAAATRAPAFAVEADGRMIEATRHEAALYDPKHQRLRD